MDKNYFISDIKNRLLSNFGKTLEEATLMEKYEAVSQGIMDLIKDDWQATRQKDKNVRNAYYFSAEFLVGRALGNNMLNYGITKEVLDALQEMGIELDEIEEREEDAALGNGGLGRLAACYMESAATVDIPVQGYGVRYSQGLFKQAIVNGFQTEYGDNWTENGDPWSVRKQSECQVVKFKDQEILAIPYDMPIIGYDSKRINTLRLWQAEAIDGFNFQDFNNFQYDNSVSQKNRAEDITRVLYPNDIQKAGKILRLKQQYFFCSASIQDMIKKYTERFPEDDRFVNFADYHIIQLNDTHPVMAIPELMRVLMDEKNLTWDDAWKIASKVFAFTNHTILEEAMERWALDIVDITSPRCLEIIYGINSRFIHELEAKGYSHGELDTFRIIKDDVVKMANLAICIATKVNGVAQLHTDILKEDTLKSWYELFPEKFLNKTNGITPRRWLVYSNPKLASLITDLLGTNDWIKDLKQLKNLEKYLDDYEVLKIINDIKHENKVALKDYIKEEVGIEIDPNSIYDVQVKRLHEYKRQLLNAFHILYLYYKIKKNPDLDMVPRTFIFGAKAAPGYFRAKAVIKFINEIARLVNNDPDIKGKIKVVFIPNFRVTVGEKVYPAADLSEQISTAGKEASGTGNMKFMLNGTPTIGTYDGANIEIVEEAGEDANFIFGARVEELREIYNLYNPLEFYHNDENLRQVVDTLVSPTIHDNGSFMFLDIYNSLINPQSYEKADNYFVLKDFDDYVKAQEIVDREYRDRYSWARKCLKNIANAGKFSSDRSILEYAKEIWGLR